MTIKRHQYALHAVASSAALLIAMSSAQAQQAAPTVQLQTVVVSADNGAPAGSAAAEALEGTGPVTGYVAPVTTTGSKSETPVIEVPQSISVITREQLEDRNVQTLGQALTYSAGLVAEPFGPDARFTNPLIRGFEANDSVYLNSFRFIRDFGAVAFEPYGQERIEILRGPASVLYGQGEPGGIVNLVAKRPTFTNFGEAGFEYGTDARRVAKVDLGGVSERNDTLSWRLTGLGRLADGQQDFTSDDRFYVAPALTWAPSVDTSLTVLGSLQYDKGTSPLGLPQAGTLDFNPNGSIPSSRYIGEPNFNDNESLLGTIGTEFRHRFNETFEFRQNTQYLSFDSDYNALYFSSLGSDFRTVTRGTSVQSERTDSFGVDNQLEAKFDTGALQHTAIVGLDYRYNNQWRSSNFTGPLTTIDVFNPTYGTPITYDPDRATLSETRLGQIGLYAQDQMRFDKLVVSTGVRQDWTDTENKISGETVRDDALTGRVGAVYLFDNGLAPFVSYSTSFSPQSGVNDLTGGLLDPTEGEQIEAGIKFQPNGWNSFITASVYDLTKSNIAAQEIAIDGSGSITTQIGEVRSRGFELEGTASLVEGLDLLASYTYTDAEITQGDRTLTTTTGNQPANIPEHSASLWLDYSFAPDTALDGVSVGAGVRYLGSRFGNNSNTIELPSVTLFDAAIRYEKDQFSAALNVNNIGDERYAASCNFGCYLGEGRSVIGSVGYKW
ncbi:TonB-dependent siderophore receptor [Tianweitania sp. BSSL-BM11]|uniref:TonB-dependent siderophore receptor n=1 Tax=Tianweitania aestuarii TaxID=2814886 RepID=A0ABS5S0M7_9HYPH|nr:TonB-dependent siderophore receptor [Tianweitania aestuarii]MBS9722102.1 TonB-dependent siderophore receptor [Tianweitania aestuarii]